MIGTKLGPFALLEKLGEGGMGVVYKAKDTRLDRFVAIKLLPELLAADPNRRARFIQEARAASALNHPNIVTIHDIAEHEGRHFIVMEYLDGKPLQDLIPRQGMRLNDALRAAVQIADALSAAHAANIVHRDLKPGNIMIDAQGRAKVLDFGLAKLTAPSSNTDAEQNETRTAVLQTDAGAIMGSVPYMSPEQAEGRAVDARSDIFSFGSVLYEMVTGQRAFQGDSRIATLAALVQRDPAPVSEVAPAVPAELEKVIGRCLRKDVARRSQSMPDVKLALEELRDDSASGKLAQPGVGKTPRGRRWLWPAIAGAFLLTAALVFAWRSRLHSTAPALPAAARMVRVSPDDGFKWMSPAISADGKFVAMISNRSGADQLWLRQTAGGEPVQITHTSPNKVTSAQFFPDGTQLLVHTRSAAPDGAGNTIEIAPLLGGPGRVVRTGQVWSPAVKPDGREIAWLEVSNKGGDHSYEVRVMSIGEGRLRALDKYRTTQPMRGFNTWLTWMPDGLSIGITGFRAGTGAGKLEWEWFTLPVDGGDPVPMNAGATLRAAGLNANSFVPAGDRLLFAAGSGDEDRRNIWQLRYDPATKRVAGPPRQLTSGTGREGAVSVTPASTLALHSLRIASDVYLLPLDPATGQPSGAMRRLTSDGRAKVVRPQGGEGGQVYFVVSGGPVARCIALDPGTSQQKQITPPVEFAAGVLVSPDGQRVAYSRGGATGPSSISVGEPGAPLEKATQLCQACGEANFFSADSKYLALSSGLQKKSNVVALAELATGRISPWLQGGPREWVLGASPLGKDHIVVFVHPPDTAGGGNKRELYVVPWQPGRPVPRSEWVELQYPEPRSPIHFSHWAPFSYSFQGNTLMRRRFEAQQNRLSSPAPLLIPPNSPARIESQSQLWSVQGPGLVFIRRDTAGSAWLMKLPPE